MNQRIRELAEQAEQYANDTVDERVHNRDFTLGDIDEVYNTKFAELIIKECIAKIEEAAEASPELYGVALEILEHFDMEIE